MRRRGSWSMWLAVRATTTAVIGIIVALVLQSAALPKLHSESKKLDRHTPSALEWVSVRPAVLPFLPVPAIILGVAAMFLRPVRGVLAALAALLTVIAMVFIVGSLVAGLAPMYQMPPDL